MLIRKIPDTTRAKVLSLDRMQELQTAMDRHPPRPDAERGAVLAANGWLH